MFNNCSFEVETEYFKSETEKKDYIDQMLNLNAFCISRGIKTRFLFPNNDTMLEGTIIKNADFRLDRFHTLKVVEK